MQLNFVLYLIIGKLFIYAIPKTPPAKWLESKHKYLQELIECGFCLGFWVYLALAFVFTPQVEGIPQIIIIKELIIAILSSFLVYVFSAGWNSLFQTYVLE